jgi:lipopolysaccharide transport system ATP-binding protein
VSVNGRVSALLELGTGFHPDMSGRENVYLIGSVQGLPMARIEGIYEEIVAFAELADFMDEPVKTYSSGMLMRLAFAVATCADPDVLIIDELLSVGDGLFARKSFDRIMDFRRAGKTILFCSHSMYQVEAICSRVIWLHAGRIHQQGPPPAVIDAYNTFLGAPEKLAEMPSKENQKPAPEKSAEMLGSAARIVNAEVSAGGLTGFELEASCQETDVSVAVRFASSPSLPCPGVGVVFYGVEGLPVTSASSLEDGVDIMRTADGSGEITVIFPQFALMRGNYTISVYLLSEDGILVYDHVERLAEIKVSQKKMELGIVSLPRDWSVPAPYAGD